MKNKLLTTIGKILGAIIISIVTVQMYAYLESNTEVNKHLVLMILILFVIIISYFDGYCDRFYDDMNK